MSLFRIFGLPKVWVPSRSLCRSFTASAIFRADPQESQVVWTHIDVSAESVNAGLHKATAKALPTKTPDDLWLERSQNARLNFVNLSRVNNNPYSGRSVKVIDGNLADAFKRLDGILARNRVRRQLKLAERHEKKGVKRRRLESERWRRLFAHEVRKNVQLVNKIRKRGA